MTPKALVIDDDPDILEAVADILRSMGHEFEFADSVDAARQCLHGSEYTYVLLDLEIPVRAGRNLPRIQNGENLLGEIIRCSGTKRMPVIVMTAHGTDGPELAVEVMKQGAVDYVTKPFKTVGKTLDKSIREMLGRQDQPSLSLSKPPHEVRPSRTTSAPTMASTPFDGGMMVFRPDRVELCGAVICDKHPRSKRQWKALELFRIREGTGFAAYSCEQIANELEIANGPGSASGFVRSLRKRIARALHDQANIVCDDEDVIVKSVSGYYLSNIITVQDGVDVDSGQDQGHWDENLLLDVPDHVPDVPNPHLPNAPGDAAGTRRAWIIQNLAKDIKLRTACVAKHFRCSRKTAQRALKELKDEGLIEYTGSTRKGYYRQCKQSKTNH